MLPLRSAASRLLLVEAVCGGLAHIRRTRRCGREPGWAAIIAVPTAVTGFYGQNVPYPGGGQLSGFISSCVVMIALAAGVYWMLRRNHWL